MKVVNTGSRKDPCHWEKPDKFDQIVSSLDLLEVWKSKAASPLLTLSEWFYSWLCIFLLWVLVSPLWVVGGVGTWENLGAWSMLCGRFPVARPTKQICEHTLRAGVAVYPIITPGIEVSPHLPTTSITSVQWSMICWTHSKSLVFGLEFTSSSLFKISNELSTLPGRTIVPIFLLFLHPPPNRI